MKIGIDIGGTNTHAVLIGSHGELLAATRAFHDIGYLDGCTSRS